jgi:hypothetical protein
MGTSVDGELYLRSIARRWKREARPDLERIRILSPYITRAADSVLRNVAAGAAEIYTRFDADLFASGASSLRSLKTLCLAGHNLYTLPSLHAKIVMVPGNFASIGSQNLTRGGTLNKEASVALTDASSIARIDKRIAKWAEERVPISIEMIDDMEALLADLKRKFRAAQAAANEADRKIALAHQERERRARRDSERMAAERASVRAPARVRRFAESFAKAPRSADSIDAQILLNGAHGHLKSLVARGGLNFTQWKVDGEPLRLDSAMRYLCIVPRLGRLGWARVMNSRITFVSSAMQDQAIINGQPCNIHVEANWNLHTEMQTNATLEIKQENNLGSCKVDLWITADHVEVRKVSPGSDDDFAKRDTRKLIRSLREEPEQFNREVHRITVEPFRYSKNLSGSYADEFFHGEIDSRHRLHVVRMDGHPVLVAEALT